MYFSHRIMKVKTALLSMVVVSVVLEVTAAGMLDVDSGKLDQFLTSAKWPRGAACLAAVLPKAHPKYTKCLGISREFSWLAAMGEGLWQGWRIGFCVCGCGCLCVCV